MTKYMNPEAEQFSRRLAQRRRAAGYTQEQLATASSLLTDLARVLNTSTDELLGNSSRQRPAHLSPRLERRLRQIERLGSKPKQQLLSLIDTFIAAAAATPPTSRPGSRS
jgi:transcriptional regulator with XRE-family HTH domain